MKTTVIGNMANRRKKDTRIEQSKIEAIRKAYFAGSLNVSVIAKELQVSRLTITRYVKEFEIIRLHYPDHVDDIGFYPPLNAFPAKQKMNRIPYRKIAILRTRYFDGTLDKKAACEELNLKMHTINRYANEFRKIREAYPEKITDKDFFTIREKAEHRQTELYVEFLKVMPEVVPLLNGKQLCGYTVYPLYKSRCPNGYALSTFTQNFSRWCEVNQVSRQRLYALKPEDIATLTIWRKGNDHQLWQIAVSLLMGAERRPIKIVAEKIEVCTKTIQEWYKMYQLLGTAAFKKKSRQINDDKKKQIKEREDNLIHLLHQSPKNFGINRTSWKQEDLASIYFKEYSVRITRTDVSRDLRRRGYRTIKSREVLTSPDPLFREKYQAIQHILQHLGPKEKFFSIDEYGPFSIKMKGGRSFVKKGDYKTYPQRQKSKGWMICTAALELSTNQVTHFYSPKKNTEEMIKLVDVLVKQYREQDKIYLSWDKAGWHISKELMNYIDVLNSDDFHKLQDIPYIGLAPLPACAQFLNVIESVFSGMARSVIHHSNYQSVEECQKAIDTYFADRNKHFKLHPHRAGNKIWGKELVPPVFDKANRCKTTNSLSTKS